MKRLIPIVLLMVATTTQAEPQSSARFSGSASLQTPAAVSADGRFAVDAELQARPPKQSSKRFAVDARLQSTMDAKSLATACGVVSNVLFQNSFEN